MSRYRLLSLCLTVMVLLPLSCGAASQASYTAYNMWYETPLRMWAINYKRGQLLPAGTKVRNITVHHQTNQPHQYISFQRASDGKQFRVYFRRKFHPGKTVEDYRRLMFSGKTFSQQTSTLSALEVDAIQRGVLVPGMSKQAAILAYGIPPQHKTPDLDNPVWRYWTSRMVSKNICFDPQGRTTHCQSQDTL